MKKKTIFAFFIILGAAILTSLAIITGFWQPSVEATPEEVVGEFYTGYLRYQGNPLVDKIYHGSPNLSPAFIAYIDEFTAGAFMVDPVVCAQDKPSRIFIDDVIQEKDRTLVTVHSDFEGHRFQIELIPDGNTWVINQVNCQIRTASYQGLPELDY